MSLSEQIKHKALELKFDLVGITSARPIEQKQIKYLQDWLDLNCPVDMQYMQRNVTQRGNPAELLKSAQSVICLAINYCPGPEEKIEQHSAELSRSHQRQTPAGRVANYALYEDYHIFIKKRLHLLKSYIAGLAETPAKFRLCVDSAPVAERSLAQRAGLGFIGKNHMLINPKLGPQLFLAELITDLPLEADEPLVQSCKGCNKCIQACPTGALLPDGRFDAAKCVSYLTIEHRGAIPPELQGTIADRLFGCDECVLACPYTQPAEGGHRSNKEIKFYPDRKRLGLKEIFELTPDSFEENFSNSPIRRPGLKNLQRNARICLQNITKLPARGGPKAD